MARERAHLWRRARTAASLPARVVATEDRTTAIERHVVVKLDEMRSELAEIRILLTRQLEAGADASAVLGRLLQETRERLEAVEAFAVEGSTDPATGTT